MLETVGRRAQNAADVFAGYGLSSGV